MTYTIGVSSGWWKIPKSPDLLGLAQKVAGFGATVGVKFIQADVETTSEFFEPRLKEEMRRVKKEMGMEVGLHAEVGELMSLESAERRLWEQSHLRLLETVKYSADFGIVYINTHFSTRPQLYYMEREYRIMGYMYPIVDFYGRPLYHICEESPQAREVTLKNLLGVQGIIHMDARELYEEIMERAYEEEYFRRVAEEKDKLRRTKIWEDAGRAQDPNAARRALEHQIETKVNHEVLEKKRQEMPEQLYKVWVRALNARYHIETAEIAAYKVVGAYMKEKGDPIWTTICNGLDAETAYIDAKTHPNMNAAVAAKYLEGHLTVKDHFLNKKYLDGMSVIEYLEKHNIILGLEIPEAHEGYEALLRLFNPLDAIPLLQKLGTDKVKLCIDFEHMLSHKMRPEDIIPKLPSEYVFLIHVSKPIPYGGTAHIPIAIGSKGQEILYGWLYEMRKRGFKDGYIIFERGGGRTGAGKSAFEVLENSVWAIRQIVEFLDKDIAPENLPPEFYGISEQNKDTYARQLVTMRDHAWDPLEGLLQIPEEKHTFLSRSAVEKQKGEVWDKRRFR